MKMVSFDIGIKNMAYCLFEVSPTPENPSFNVLDWNVIDLTETQNESQTAQNTHICGCALKTKRAKDTRCGKRAKYCKNDEYVCEPHAKTHTQYLLPSKEHTLGYFRKQKVESIAETYRALGLPESTEAKNEGRCIPTKPEMIGEIVRYYENRTFSEIRRPKKNANDANLLHIGWAIRRVLDTLAHFRDITHVVIENQISPIATRMKTIQGMLAQYFIMKSSLDSPVEIVFVSSSNKLRVRKEAESESVAKPRKPKKTAPTTPEKAAPETTPTQTPATATIQTPNYKQNKKDSVVLCREIISENPVLGKWSGNVDVGRGVSKKDDLADCFLQGIWYMVNRNIITCAENLKINIV
jgi:hypothetical protein